MKSDYLCYPLFVSKISFSGYIDFGRIEIHKESSEITDIGRNRKFIKKNLTKLNQGAKKIYTTSGGGKGQKHNFGVAK